MPPVYVSAYTQDMSDSAFEVPLNEADGHLPEVISAASERGAIAYLTDHGRRVAAIVPADDAWYWTPGWQAAEAEADADFREGRSRRFDSMEDLFTESDAIRGETSA
ncbi:hypothetical protein GCM10020216_056840 [Nonomuraea helvata]